MSSFEPIRSPEPTVSRYRAPLAALGALLVCCGIAGGCGDSSAGPDAALLAALADATRSDAAPDDAAPDTWLRQF